MNFANLETDLESMLWSKSQKECILLMLLTAHNWQKMKKVFMTCPCHEIYRDEAVRLKKCNYTCEYVEFGAISWEFEILSITA